MDSDNQEIKRIRLKRKYDMVSCKLCSKKMLRTNIARHSKNCLLKLAKSESKILKEVRKRLTSIEKRMTKIEEALFNKKMIVESLIDMTHK